MTTEERTKVLNWLDESHREFLAGIDGLTDDQWKWKPAEERWSVGETAEHIVLAEGLMFAMVQRAVSSPANSGWEEQTKDKTELLERVIPSRVGTAQAPEPVVPRQGLTRTQLVERFRKQRAVIAKFAAETQIPLKQHTVDHPFPGFGRLHAYQWLILVPLHTIRHDKQIAEVKATAGFPK
jgi:uncharacterized damage-inducible protein DinB